MESEKRLRDIIRNAAPNDGLAFPHWFGGGMPGPGYCFVCADRAPDSAFTVEGGSNA